jgi:hypothetical protein
MHLGVCLKAPSAPLCYSLEPALYFVLFVNFCFFSRMLTPLSSLPLQVLANGVGRTSRVNGLTMVYAAPEVLRLLGYGDEDDEDDDDDDGDDANSGACAGSDRILESSLESIEVMGSEAAGVGVRVTTPGSPCSPSSVTPGGSSPGRRPASGAASSGISLSTDIYSLALVLVEVLSSTMVWQQEFATAPPFKVFRDIVRRHRRPQLPGDDGPHPLPDPQVWPLPARALFFICFCPCFDPHKSESLPLSHDFIQPPAPDDYSEPVFCPAQGLAPAHVGVAPRRSAHHPSRHSRLANLLGGAARGCRGDAPGLGILSLSFSLAPAFLSCPRQVIRRTEHGVLTIVHHNHAGCSARKKCDFVYLWQIHAG